MRGLVTDIERLAVDTDSVPMKVYTLCAPPNHRDEFVHHICANAAADDEHLDGRTTE